MNLLRAACATTIVGTLAACGSAPPGAEEPEATTGACRGPGVTLRFAWPDGLEARVTSHEVTRSENIGGGDPMHGESEARFTMRVSAPDGVSRDVRFAVAEPRRLRTNGLVPAIGDAAAGVRLDQDGRVSAVLGQPEIAGALDALGAEGSLDSNQIASLRPMLESGPLLENARGAWASLLAAWHGTTLQCGERSARIVTSNVYFAAQTLPVDLDAELEYVEPVDCPSTRDGGSRCVHLTLRAVPDPESLRSATAGYTRRSGIVGRRIAEAQVMREVHVVVEVDTLVPHLFDFAEEARVVWEDAAGERFGRRIVDAQRYEFQYGGATIQMILGENGSGFAVVDETGQPVSLPDTPECDALDACCAAVRDLPGAATAQLSCALFIAPTDTPPNCTAALASVQAVLLGGGAPALPAACASR